MSTLIELIPAYRDYLRFERDLATGTLYCYTSDIRGLAKFLGDKPVDVINRDDLRAYMRSLSKRKFKANTIRRVIAGFSTFWTWMMLEKHVSENVSRYIQLPRKNVVQPRWMDESDLRAFAAACEAAPEDRISVSFLLLAFTGMRPGELRALRVADLNLETGSMTVRNTKSRRDRVLPIPEHLQPRIAALVKGRFNAEFVFGNQGMWDRKQQHFAFRALIAEAGLKGKGYTMYSLRHSVGTLLALNAVPPQVIRDYLGHANLTTTDKYLHAAGVDLKRALARHPLMEKTG